MSHPPPPSAPQTVTVPGRPAVRRKHRSFKTLRNVMALVFREMGTSYGRNPGGYLWAVLEPIGAITLLAVVFSFAFRSPPLGTSFALFYATGYLPFTFYSDLAQKIGISIRFSRPLLAYPAVRYIDSILARFVLNLLTHLLVVAIVFYGIIVMQDLTVILDWEKIIVALAMSAALGFSVGVLNCFLFETIRVWERVWSIANRPLFIVSGVLFTFESIPAPFDDYLWYNPLIHSIGLMRAGMFATYDATYVSALYVFGVCAIATMFGLIFLNRYHRKILNDD